MMSPFLLYFFSKIAFKRNVNENLCERPHFYLLTYNIAVQYAILCVIYTSFPGSLKCFPDVYIFGQRCFCHGTPDLIGLQLPSEKAAVTLVVGGGVTPKHDSV